MIAELNEFPLDLLEFVFVITVSFFVITIELKLINKTCMMTQKYNIIVHNYVAQVMINQLTDLTEI